MTASQYSLLPDLADFEILSDSIPFLERCAQRGLHTKDIARAQRLARNSIVFSFSDGAAKKTFELAKLTVRKRCIFFPLHVFEASIDNASYSLECFLKSDITRSLPEQRKALELVNSKSPLTLVGHGTQSTVTISNDAVPYAILEEDVQGDFVHSVAEFFEVHFAHLKQQDPCPFLVSGEFLVFGMLAVLRRADSVPIGIKALLNTLRGEVASKQALLKVSNNVVRSFKVDGRDYIDLIQRAAGPRGANLTEFAIGVNRAVTPLVDFSINSQMNEGVSGVHVAVGDGTTGYHIDFLCPGVIVESPRA